SYSSLLEPYQDDRDFLSNLLQETLLPYPNPSVWLGFLECVLLSKDHNLFFDDSSMTSFLKRAVLSKAWGEILSSLEQSEHAQLLQRVQEFISVAIPEAQYES